MTDLLQPPTILFSYRTVRPASSGTPPVKEVVSLKPDMIGTRFGSWEIISREIRRKGKQILVYTRCSCGWEQWTDRWNLQKGKTLGCLTCMGKANRITPSSPVLGRRYDAIKSRCQNTANPGYKDYGGRGIQCIFTRPEFCLYVEKYLPHKNYRGVEIDRINNDGNYEPGNLRLASRDEQMVNRRCTVWTSYKGVPVPRHHAYHVIRTVDPKVLYAPATINNILRQAVTIESVMERYYTLPSDKPKGLTTLPTPDPVIASLYLVSSSTTADMASDG
jgi:hypothetical protein